MTRAAARRRAAIAGLAAVLTTTLLGGCTEQDTTLPSAVPAVRAPASPSPAESTPSVRTSASATSGAATASAGVAGRSPSATAAPARSSASKPKVSAVAPISPSGAALPVGDLPGWHQVIAQDFNTNVAVGHFKDVYSGWAGYDQNRDSSRGHDRPLNEQGLWNSVTTMSVHDGVLDCRLHTDGVTPEICAVTPTTTGRWWEGQMYGRYSVRFRTDPIPGYKIAWLLFPSSDKWPEGEVDFPEGDLNGTITAGAHDVTGNPIDTVFFTDTGTTMSDWHTATIEWTPGKLTFALDSRTWTTTKASGIPTHLMRWALQAESSITKDPPARSISGHIQIDWLTEYRYQP